MNYHFFRLSLSENAAPPLLEIGFSADRPARDAFLRRLFSEEQIFVHRKQEFKYKPFGEDGSIIYGAIGRRFVTGTHDESFSPGELQGWEIANIFLDTSGDKDGQKLVVQHNIRVGQPTAYITSFVDHLNDASPRDTWWITVFTMSDQSDLWEVEKKHRGEITRINLRFAVPNMLRSSDTISDELKDIGKEVHGQEVEMDIIRHQGGLSLQNDYIKNAVNYITQGAGQIIVKVKKKIIFNSRKTHLTKNIVDDIDISSSGKDEIVDRAKRLLEK